METIKDVLNENSHRQAKDPDLIKHLSEAKRKVWRVLKSHYDRIKDGEFRIDLSELGRHLGYSRTAIHWAVKTLISGGLLEKTREVRGRGNHSVYRLLWAFKVENETPSRTLRVRLSPKKKLTKDSPLWRYFAMKYRRICEGSTKLAPHQRDVVGKLLKTLRNHEGELWKKAEIFLQRKVNSGLTLQGFFVWLEQYLKPEISEHYETEKTLNSIRESRERKQDELANMEGEPPKMKDFDTIGAYQEAYDKYLNNQPG